MTARNNKSVYVCINYGEAYAPEQISHRSICIDNDIGEVLHMMNMERAISCFKCVGN